MIPPLIKIGALKLGSEFQTSLTKRRGCILDRHKNGSPGIVVAMEDGVTLILHEDIRVRPVEVIH